MTAVQRPDDNQTQRASRLSLATVRQRLGAVLLVAVILTVIAIELWPSNNPDPPTPPASPTPPTDELTLVNGYGGGLKVAFLTDPDVSRILAERYQLRVQIEEYGSNEIACNIPLGPEDDFVWLGDPVMLERHKQCKGGVLSHDNIYYSPIVLYSWTPIVDSLVAAGLARLEANGSYSIDFAALVTLIDGGQTWASIGLPEYHGALKVQTSDPLLSNSGFLFAGLLANTLNGGNVVTAATVDPLLPRIQSIIQKNGYMPRTSAELWNLFFNTGIPMVALYESQIIEHIVARPAQLTQINRDIRTLYPTPTFWATHPFAARTSDGELLMRALMDPDIQRLAAEKHGHRPSVAPVPFAPDVTGIREQITSVSPMPATQAMDEILDAIAAVPNTPTPVSSPISSLNTAIAMVWPAARQSGRAGRRRSRLPRRQTLHSDG